MYRPLLLFAALLCVASAGRVPRGVPALNNTCLCVPFYNCEDGQLITDGAGLLNPRFGPRDKCTDFNICCNDEQTIKKIEAKPGVDKSVMTTIKDGISELFSGGSKPSVGAGECVCVAFYLCDGGVLSKEIANQVDLRQVSSTGRCNNDNEQCCSLPRSAEPTAPLVPACNCTSRQYCSERDVQPLRLGQVACRSDEVCCSNPQVPTGGSGTGAGGIVPDTERPDYDLWKFCKSYPLSVACVRSRQITGRPTLLPAKNFDPDLDADELNKAIGRWDATDSVLIDILTRRTFEQRYLIAQAYYRKSGRNLADAISSTTRGHFDDLMVALVRNAGYYEYLAEELRDAMHRAGTDEDTVLETLISSTSEEIQIIRRHYSRLSGNPDLIADIKDDFSGDLEDILVALVNGSRDNSFRVSKTLAAEQAAALYQAGEGRLGTEEETFKYYLTHENYAQLALIFSEYEQLARESFAEALEDEFSRHVEDATLAIVEVTRNLPRFLALRLHDALWGRGPLSKDDSSLIRLIVSRAEIDLGTISEEYYTLYDRKLIDDVQLKSTGDYDTALSRLLGGN
ncbi:Annexin A3 [Amphibalanus amphitrite]|uniref:Annexin A3 n=1 Tax=Amphibalanus amphitrite TaxID=1232801 RepID=A0A6A4WJX7_AMPAM|nr:Annexin A3 [Amphibalanus amphitrite]